jgi:hypothetical protein
VENNGANVQTECFPAPAGGGGGSLLYSLLSSVFQKMSHTKGYIFGSYKLLAKFKTIRNLYDLRIFH